jgi:TPR repeat protein
MNVIKSRTSRRTAVMAVGLVVFFVLLVRYSPDWIAFGEGLKEALVEAEDPAKSDAIARAILSGHSERGYHVMQQATNPGVEIPDPMHKAVRWRLLFPGLTHVLGLPAWTALAWAHLGCVVLVFFLVSIGFRANSGSLPGWTEGLGLGLVAGATAPFFASMGWLGYFDSWLAVGLLAVAFAGHPGMVLAACLLVPWVDERFVLGFPLALLVRWLRVEMEGGSDFSRLRRETLGPLVAVFACAVLRLWLSGRGGSQTVGDYLDQFVLMENIPVRQRLLGAWAGLGVAWLLALAAVAVCWQCRERGGRWKFAGPALAGTTLVTGVAGSFTALDLARSTVLLLPVVPLGWMLGSPGRRWQQLRLSIALPVLALLLPAWHVAGRIAVPVDAWWRPSLALVGAQNNLGVTHRQGMGLPPDLAEAARWFRRSAEQGHGPAQNNLALAYERGEGVPKDAAAAAWWFRQAAGQGIAAAQASLADCLAGGRGVAQDEAGAVTWYRRAAEQGYAPAQSNLGVLYAEGRGVAADPAEAVRWYRRAAEQGNAVAQVNLAVACAGGVGVARDREEAARWYVQAARQGHPTARNNLGILYAEGDVLPRNLVLAHVMFSLAAADGEEHAPANLGLVEEQMSPDQVAEARARLARDDD